MLHVENTEKYQKIKITYSTKEFLVTEENNCHIK